MQPSRVRAPAQLDPTRLEELVGRYQVGELLGHWPAAGGIENRNYFLSTRRGRVERQYVLTVLERPPYAGDAFVPLLDHCVSAGLPVPAILRTGSGCAISELEGRPAMLCPRLPGRHLHNPTERQVAALGRFLGRFHRATAGFEPALPEYPRGPAWLTDKAAQCRGLVPYGEAVFMADCCARVQGALARRDARALPRGPIHGDLFRDNVLFDDLGLTGVLDFHHAAQGYLVYDLAVAANDWCTGSDGALDPERALALLRAYHRQRPLARAELWFFPVFALYAALAFWISRQVVMLAQQRGEPVRARNPEEMRRIAAHHSAHFFYLDERALD